LTSGQFTTGCGNSTAAPIFNAALMNSGLYGESNLIVVSDPDIVLINNQWWMIFATGPTGLRAIQPFAAYLPPGASLSTTTTYPSDPNGWHLVGAAANGGFAIPVYGYPGTNGWDQLAAETPSVDVGPDGSVSIYYSGHNAGQTPFQIGLMTNFVNGQATGDPNPVMTATLPWEYSAGLPALLEQSVRWIPSLNKFIMYYTAGAWWANPAPDNDIAYAESTDGINWVNRQPLGFPVAYYNQDFLYNEQHHRFEMVISKDRTGAGGGNPRDIVWREAATAATSQANWVNETDLLLYGGGTFFDSGVLSPSMKYGNLPGEENRLYVFFHSYDSAGNMQIGRFYCDAAPSTTPTFSLSQSNPAVAVVQNSGTTMTFGVNAQSGFTGAVNFSVSGVPSGVNASLTQTASTTGTTLAIFVQPTAVPGRYPIVVTGTSGNITQTSTFTLTVNEPASFSLTSSTANLSLAPGAGNTLSINVTPLYGFTGTVNFSASGFPAAVNDSFLQTSSTTGSTFVIYVQPTAVPGKYPITVAGTSGSLSATTNFTLTITSPPTFTLTPSVPAVSVTQGSGTTVNVAVNAQSGFTSAVGFSASGFPSGVTAAFQPARSATATTLSVAASSSAVPGQYPITVTGTSGSLTASTNVTLTVMGAPRFSLTPSATAASLQQSTGATLNIGVSPLYGFTGTVSFSASGFPAAVNNTFLPASSTTGSVLVMYVQPTAAPGQYPITVTGTSGTLTQTTAFTLSVTPAPLQPQTITFPTISSQTVGAPLTLSATANSGLPVSFNSSTSSVCTVSGTTASFSAAGTCTITASQAGNGSYNPAPSVTQSFAVNIATPSAVSVSPSAGSALSQVFTAVYSDPTGASNISSAFVLFNTSVSSAGACYVQYYPSSNLLYLKNDAGTGLSSGIAPGSSATVSNSQCTLSGTGSSYTVSGNSATLNVALTFTSAAFNNIYLSAAEKDGSNSGWIEKGGWGAAAPPSVVSLSPTSGSSTTQTFTAVFSDLNGASSINEAYMLFNTSVSATGACWVEYNAITKVFSLEGSSTLANSECTLSTAGSSYATSGNTATLTVALTFAGTSFNNVYLSASDKGGKNSGWVQKGTWGTALPPAVVSVTPNSGSGATQTFTAVYSDPNGAALINAAYILINTSVSGTGACWVEYNPITQLLYLQGNSTGIAPGSASTVSNSKCTLAGTGSSYTVAGNTATLEAALTFTGSAPENIYVYASDKNSKNTGWINAGSWTP